MHYVVGSGPSGVACARALVNRGLDVTMLDVGRELPAPQQRALEEVRGRTPGHWPPDALTLITAQSRVTARGIDRKRAYGSDFVYADAGRDPGLVADGVDVVSSVARGGFSNVWGAAVLPVAASDIDDWPMTTADLAPHYEAVLRMMPLAARHDDLASRFPLHADGSVPLRASAQAGALLEDLARHRRDLSQSGFTFGASRLAVAPHTPFAAAGCVYCGLCLTGCPYGVIYNSAATLAELSRCPTFRYIPGVTVRTVRERAGGMEIDADDEGEGRRRFAGARVFLAAGVVATTKILLDSMDAAGEELTMKQSQYFAFPWLRYRGAPHPRGEAVHTLAQAFIELHDPTLTASTVHLQVYTYNDLYWSALGPIMRWAPSLTRRALEPLMARLLYVQGYLHSDISSGIAVRLSGRAGGSRLELAARVNHAGAAAIANVMQRMSRSRRLFGAVPLHSRLMIGRPGYGAHVGSTFPMRAMPKRFESDLLGRPHGFSRVHVVDASSLPSLPATTLTLTVMANAHRIGTAA